jgi:hypothetical protein
MPLLLLYNTGDENLQELESMSEKEREKVEIVDLAWDFGEDHLVVSFGHGKMAMIDFNGLTAEKTQWKFYFERQKQGNSVVEWLEDRSGDFMTSTSKVGIIKVFNVA